MASWRRARLAQGRRKNARLARELCSSARCQFVGSEAWPAAARPGHAGHGGVGLVGWAAASVHAGGVGGSGRRPGISWGNPSCTDWEATGEQRAADCAERVMAVSRRRGDGRAREICDKCAGRAGVVRRVAGRAGRQQRQEARTEGGCLAKGPRVRELQVGDEAGCDVRGSGGGVWVGGWVVL